MSDFFLIFAKIYIMAKRKSTTKSNSTRGPRRPNVPKAGVKNGTRYGNGGCVKK